MCGWQGCLNYRRTQFDIYEKLFFFLPILMRLRGTRAKGIYYSAVKINYTSFSTFTRTVAKKGRPRTQRSHLLYIDGYYIYYSIYI